MSNTSITDAYHDEYGDIYDDDVIPMTPEVMIPSAIGLIVLIIVGIGGNVLTIAAYIRDKRLRKVYNYLILNLAIVDLFLCTISMPFYAVYTLKEFTWPFGNVFCKIWLVIDFTCCFESILMMIMLSADRLLMILMGTMYYQTITTDRVQIVMGISWFISFLVYGPAIIGWDHWVGYSTVEPEDCDVEFAHDQGYTGTTALIEFSLPFICVTSINAIIFYKIWQRRPVSPTIGNELTPSSSISNMIDNSATEIGRNTLVKTLKATTAQRMRSHEIKAGRLLTTMALAFLICWLPYTITTVMISFCDDCVNTSLYEFFTWLLWVKSALNPLIYAYKSRQYRANFHKMLCCGRLNALYHPTCTETTDSRATHVASNLPSSELTTNSWTPPVIYHPASSETTTDSRAAPVTYQPATSKTSDNSAPSQ